MNDLSYGIKIWPDLSSVLSQCTRLTDGRTDKQTDSYLIAIPRLHSMQRGKNHNISAECFEMLRLQSGNIDNLLRTPTKTPLSLHPSFADRR